MGLIAELQTPADTLPARRRGRPTIAAFENASHWRSLAVALVKTSRDCVKLIDVDGRVVALSPAGRHLLQIDDPAEIVGRLWEDLWSEPERGLVRDSVERGNAGSVSTFQGFCATAKGEPRWWEVQVSPVVDESGAVRCLLATSRDVTAQHEREQEMQEALKRQRAALLSLSADFDAKSQRLRDAEARAAHDDKLRLFGRFVGGVVHDFNNVFAAVHGAARLLRRRVTDAAAVDIVSHVERAAERGAGLARQLLDFARNDRRSPEVFDPAELLARDAHLLRHIVSGEAKLTVEIDPGVWHVLGSPQNFQSVLFNLVANARDAIRADGRIEVRLANCPSRVASAGARRRRLCARWRSPTTAAACRRRPCGAPASRSSRRNRRARAPGSASPRPSNSRPPAAAAPLSRARRAPARASWCSCAARRSRARRWRRRTPASIPRCTAAPSCCWSRTIR